MTRFPVFVILSVRVTPVFSRCRRVAQRLERLLDTQEVGGSSPPVPTTSEPASPQHPRMSQVTVTLPDGSSRTVPAGTPVRDVAAEISPGLAKAALAGIVDEQARGPFVSHREGRRRSASSPTGARKRCRSFRHSTAHLLAAAVTSLFPARSAASARRPTRASSTTSWSSGRSCRRTSSGSRRR